MEVQITPFHDEQVQPAGYDLTLGQQLLVYGRECPGGGLDTEAPLDMTTPWTVAEGESVLLQPGQFVLGATVEWISLGIRHSGQVSGISTLTRQGLVYPSGGTIDPGFAGHLTLPLHNVSPHRLRIAPGQRIGQLHVIRLSSAVDRPYGTPALGSRYQDQRGPTAGHARPVRSAEPAQPPAEDPPGDNAGTGQR